MVKTLHEYKITHNLINEYFTEYARKLSKIADVSVKFIKIESKDDCYAAVDIKNNIILLPKIDFSKSIECKTYRKLKSFLSHECAHLMYQDNSYYLGPPIKYTNNEKQLVNLAKIFDDLRIENLIYLEHRDLNLYEDFKFLINEIWKDNYDEKNISTLKEGSGKYGDFSNDLFSSFYWVCQKHYRGANLMAPKGFNMEHNGRLVDGCELFFNLKITPLLDSFITSREPALPIAIQVLDRIKTMWPLVFSGIV